MKAIRYSVLIMILLLTTFLPIQLHAEDAFKKARENSGIGLDELDKKLTLFFFDAVTGVPIQKANFTLEGSSGVTDSSGKVTVDFPKADKPEVTLYGSFEKTGYITTKIPIHLLVGTVFINRYSISPVLTPGQICIVLDWGNVPPDLDAHFFKPGSYHISFRDMHNFEDKALLDHDATNGKGPETITINRIDPVGVYTYYVYDYTNKDNKAGSQFKQSNAHVMVFGDNRLLKSYEVPSGKGHYWIVFDIKDGTFIDRMEMTDKKPE